MGIKLLIAFDDSENAMRAVESAARSFSPDSHVTLFHAAQDSSALCKMNSPELTPLFKHEQSEFCTLEDTKRELVENAFRKATEILVDNGFIENDIVTKHVKTKYDVARDIINEAASNYDILVLGKRGISGIKDFLFGGTTQKVIHGVDNVSVFIVN
ncbi:MAG: universal stress protein [Deltaproteobacteria bacterium]|nr:universal stress protein [Deltaproteobacteria bacterium]MBW2632832.1 universal stress protein [Deltaproteobacteria bacterium]